MSRDTDTESEPDSEPGSDTTTEPDSPDGVVPSPPTGMQFDASAALLFMYIGGVVTLILLGGLGYLSTAVVSELATAAGVVALAVFAVVWAYRRATGG